MSHDVSIELRELELEARIGVSDRELEVERRLLVDLTLASPANAATESDSITDTVDYAAVATAAARVARGAPHRTLERLAAKIAASVLEGFDLASVEVEVSKPDPPMEETLGVAAVRVRVEAGR